MRRWRRTEAGKRNLSEQKEKSKVKKKVKVCEHCKVDFTAYRKDQTLCDECIPEHGVKYAQKRYRQRTDVKAGRCEKRKRAARVKSLGGLNNV
jgi:hypothetical protein